MMGGGYVCAPYLHVDSSIKLKEVLERSEYVDDMYFATATFSEDGGAYFPSRTNTYLLAHFNDYEKTINEVEKYKQDKPIFVFRNNDEFFERMPSEKLNLVSIYYLDGHSSSDLLDLAMIVAKRQRVRRAEWDQMSLSTTEQPKFTFPYGDNLIVLEVSSDNTHQSDNKYCEKTRKEVARKGIRLTNLLNLSIIEKIK
jgi:hypothetical protein